MWALDQMKPWLEGAKSEVCTSMAFLKPSLVVSAALTLRPVSRTLILETIVCLILADQ